MTIYSSDDWLREVEKNVSEAQANSKAVEIYYMDFRQFSEGFYIRKIRDIFKSSDKIKKLVISASKIKDKVQQPLDSVDITNIASLMEENQSITDISIQADLDYFAIKSLPSLIGMKSIFKLEFVNHEIHESEVEEIIKLISDLPNIREFRILNSEVDLFAFPELATLADSKTLTALALDSQNKDILRGTAYSISESVKDIGNKIVNNSVLEDLKISGRISIDACNHFLDCMKKNKSIKTVTFANFSYDAHYKAINITNLFPHDSKYNYSILRVLDLNGASKQTALYHETRNSLNNFCLTYKGNNPTEKAIKSLQGVKESVKWFFKHEKEPEACKGKFPLIKQHIFPTSASNEECYTYDECLEICSNKLKGTGKPTFQPNENQENSMQLAGEHLELQNCCFFHTNQIFNNKYQSIRAYFQLLG